MRSSKKKYDGSSMQAGIILVVLSLLVSVVYISKSDIFLKQCANSNSCKESLAFKVENNKEAVFNNQKISVPQIDLSQVENVKEILGVEDSSREKRIYINLTTQTLSAYDGDELFMETPISSGLWGKTPIGEFTVWIKIRSTTMSGGSGEDYYYLPNVQHVMYFSNNQVPASRGFGIHGTYWHNNFGHPMSHGCINMKNTDVAKLYEWATPISDGHTTHSAKDNPGTKIIIYEES